MAHGISKLGLVVLVLKAMDWTKEFLHVLVRRGRLALLLVSARSFHKIIFATCTICIPSERHVVLDSMHIFPLSYHTNYVPPPVPCLQLNRQYHHTNDSRPQGHENTALAARILPSPRTMLQIMNPKNLHHRPSSHQSSWFRFPHLFPTTACQHR